MSNIILPKVQILDTIGDEAKILIEQDGEINRFAVANLGGGDISINLEDTIYGNANPINADTLNGYTAKELFRPKAGFIYPLAGSVIPEGFLLCDGAEYGRTEFPELYAAIGTIYGEGNGSTTFNVPNLQTRVPVGAGNGYGLGSTGGEATHTLTVDEMPSHGHDTFAPEKTGSDWNYFISATATAVDTSNFIRVGNTNATGGSQSHNNMQPYTVVNYIIATGKDTGVSVSDIVMGAQAIPLGVEYGGTGATNAADALKNLGINKEITDRVICGKGKNLLKNTAKNQTSNGVTFTVNDDGSITANGTATNHVYLYIPITLESGKQYILSGCPKGGGNESYNVMIQGYVNGSLTFPASDKGNGNTFTHPEGITNCELAIKIAKGVNVSNLTFYPMIRLASETDDTYEPYYKGLAELADRGMELLWENASPTSEFAAQTISLDLSGYNLIVIEYKRAYNIERTLFGIHNAIGGGVMTDVYTNVDNEMQNASRLLSASTTGVTFNGSNRQYADETTRVDHNGYLVPIRIYGIKGVSA